MEFGKIVICDEILISAPGHGPRSVDAAGDELCDGAQRTPHHEHAHRLPAGADDNIGDIWI